MKVEFARKEDFISVHGRWPVNAVITKWARKTMARSLRFRFAATAVWGPYRKGRGDQAGYEIYQCPHVEQSVTMVPDQHGGERQLPARPPIRKACSAWKA